MLKLGISTTVNVLLFGYANFIIGVNGNQQTLCISDTGRCIFVTLSALPRLVAYNIAKVQIMRRVASGLKVLWYGSMEWNVEEYFSMEWNTEWNILVWIGNGLEENYRTK